ncbi:MAG: flavin reductase family protein [Proteobacteria bacterium]|nr:flavin reductase family protein [Pseudomonadota bacterium]
MEKSKVEPPLNAYRLLNPGSVVLISVGNGERDNLFPVTWNMPVRKEPGMVAILSGKRHYSYPFIAETGEFGINIPDASITDAVFGCGRTTGSKVKDKFARFGLSRQKSVHIKAPLVAEAVANLECRVCQVVDLGTSSLVIANILDARASTEHFRDGNWIFENGLKLLHHLGGDRFCVSDSVIVAQKN